MKKIIAIIIISAFWQTAISAAGAAMASRTFEYQGYTFRVSDCRGEHFSKPDITRALYRGDVVIFPAKYLQSAQSEAPILEEYIAASLYHRDVYPWHDKRTHAIYDCDSLSLWALYQEKGLEDGSVPTGMHDVSGSIQEAQFLAQEAFAQQEASTPLVDVDPIMAATTASVKRRARRSSRLGTRLESSALQDTAAQHRATQDTSRASVVTFGDCEPSRSCTAQGESRTSAASSDVLALSALDLMILAQNRSVTRRK